MVSHRSCLPCCPVLEVLCGYGRVRVEQCLCVQEPLYSYSVFLMEKCLSASPGGTYHKADWRHKELGLLGFPDQALGAL